MNIPCLMPVIGKGSKNHEKFSGLIY